MTVQTGPPYKFTAGDSVTFSIPANASYPAASGWTMAFLMMYPGWTPQSFPAAAQADGSWLVTVIPANTDTILPEEYATASVFTNAALNQRKTCYSRPCWVVPDPTKEIAATVAMTLLQQFQSALIGLSTGKVASATIDSNTYTAKELDDVQKQIAIWQAAVDDEMNQLKLLQDQPVPDHIETQWRGAYGCYWPGTAGIPGFYGYP